MCLPPWENGLTKPKALKLFREVDSYLQIRFDKEAHALQQEKPPQWDAHALQLESSPHLPQLEIACMQQQRPRASENK